MDAKVIENKRTAMAQKITRQPDGPGKRIGVKGRDFLHRQGCPRRSKTVP